MDKLKLIIADRDQAYLKALNNYCLVQKIHSFEVLFISNAEYLKEVLERTEDYIDILLINPNLMVAGLDLTPVKMQISLVEIEASNKHNSGEHKKVISKYQPVDKLINQVLQLFNEENPEKDISVSERQSDTKVVLFYSPLGGSGNTLSSIAASTIAAILRKKVLYLNLENISSHHMVLPKEDTIGASRLYYAIKKRNSNLMLKLESAKSIDSYSNLHYISPPDSMMDLEEFDIYDIKHLIQVLRGSKTYEYVFIDISSQINAKNRFLMEECDYLTLVLTTTPVSAIKASLLERELQNNKLAIEITKKITVIQNEYLQEKSISDDPNFNFLNTKVAYRMPATENIYIDGDMGLRLNMESDFVKVISKYVAQLVNSNQKEELLWKEKV